MSKRLFAGVCFGIATVIFFYNGVADAKLPLLFTVITGLILGLTKNRPETLIQRVKEYGFYAAATSCCVFLLLTASVAIKAEQGDFQGLAVSLEKGAILLLAFPVIFLVSVVFWAFRGHKNGSGGVYKNLFLVPLITSFLFLIFMVFALSGVNTAYEGISKTLSPEVSRFLDWAKLNPDLYRSSLMFREGWMTAIFDDTTLQWRCTDPVSELLKDGLSVKMNETDAYVLKNICP